MATTYQIFAVDTNTGQVYIAGNLFVQSADKAGDSWIVGDMINASSVIELADGAIVLDGVNGRITVFDPTDLNNGNFIQIEDGFVRQYKAYKLIKTLNTIETGICQTGTWETLVGYYLHKPSVYVSPRLINTFDKNYAAQDQLLSCYVTDIQKVSEGRWRFKAGAQLKTGIGDYFVTPPTSVTGVGAGYWRYPLSTQKTTTTAAVTCPGCNKITVMAAFMPVYEYGSPAYWYGGKLRWRIKYRLSGASSWSYSPWTAYVEQTVWNDWSEKTNTLSISVAQGTYEVCFEIYSELGSALKRDNGFTERPPEECDYWRARSIILNSSATNTAASGLLAFTAVGE